MSLLKINFSALLLYLINCLNVATSATVSNSQIINRKNVFQMQKSLNEKIRSKIDNKRKDSDFHNNKISSMLNETSLVTSSIMKGETASNTLNIPVESHLNLTKTHKLKGKSGFWYAAKKNRLPFTVNKNLIKNFRYTSQEVSNITSIVSTNIGLEQTPASSKFAFTGSYCQNPCTSSYHEKHPTKKLKYDFSCSSSISTELNRLINTFVPTEHKLCSSLANLGVQQANTQHNLPYSVSNSRNTTNYHVSCHNIITPVINSPTHSCCGRWSIVRKIPQYSGVTPVIIIHCSDTLTIENKTTLDQTTIARNVYKISAINEPSLILYDTPYSLNERTPDQFCDYLFSVNGYIIYRKLTDKSKKFSGGVILEFDNATNKIKKQMDNKTQNPDNENSLCIVTSCPKIYYKVPIFVPLNFTTPPNLQHFSLSTTRNDFGIIFTVEILVSFVDGVIPNIDNTFLRWKKTPYISIIKFILSAKFPIYSFKISETEGGSLWFSKEFSLIAGKFRGYMTIQQYFNSLKPPSLDFKRRTNSYRYKEVKDFSSEAKGTFISLNITEDIIYKTCISFSEAFREIQRILDEDPETKIDTNQLEIDILISDMIKNLEPNWCITYHKDVVFSSQICGLISFYSFFYYEVKYVLEYCLKVGHFPLINLEQ